MGINIIPVIKAPPLELQNPDTTPTPYPEFQQLQRFGKKKTTINTKNNSMKKKFKKASNYCLENFCVDRQRTQPSTLTNAHVHGTCSWER